MQNLGDRHPVTIELASWLVYVLCDFKATWHQETYFSVSWIYHGSTSWWCLYFTFLVKVLPPPFYYSLGSYLYLFLLYILLSQNLYQDQFQYILKLPEKNASFPLLWIYLLLRNQVSAENSCAKVSGLIAPS